MNDEIRILREVVVKVTQLLAGKGLEVTQRGTQAFVATDPRTLKPKSVNIPFIPDNATKDLILAIQGFIDHEVGHVLETDWAVVLKAVKMKGNFHSLWNLAEDPFIERKMMKRFSGSGYNMERLHEFFIFDITTPALDKALAAEDWMRCFSVLMVPYARAWAGQRLFQQFVKEGDYLNHPEIGPMLRRIEHLAPEFAKVECSQDSLDLAIKLDEALKPPPPAPPIPAPSAPPPPKEEEPENEPQDANGGEGETPEDEGKGAGNEDAPEDQDADENDGKGEGDEDADAASDEAGGEETPEDDDKGGAGDDLEEDEDASDTDGAGGAEEEGDSDDDTEEGAGGASDGASDDDDATDEDEKSEGDADASGAPEDAGDDQKDDQKDDQNGDEGEVGSSGAPGDDDAGDESGGEDEEAGESSNSDTGDDDGAEGDEGSNSGGDEDEAAEPENADGVSEGGEGSNDGAPPEPLKIEEENDATGGEVPNFSGQITIESGAIDFDALAAARIGEEARDATALSPYRIYTKDFDKVETFPVDMDNYEDAWLTGLDDRTRTSVGVMQKEIQRMMAARSQSINVPGFRSGRLHTAGLHRLAAGDDRVFRRRHENPSKDTAIMLLIDNSGSMDGQKMHTAMEAGYALSSTLERVGIKHEVMGYTTRWQDWRSIQEAQTSGQKAGIRYSRTEPLYMPVYKGFDERLTSEVKRRFAAAPHTDFMGANVDGESVELAANRLIVRPETRKVMLVLSDGNPVSDGDNVALRHHLKQTVADITKRGIETIGLGICTDAPRHFYPKFALLPNAADLPKTVMGELKRILLS